MTPRTRPSDVLPYFKVPLVSNTHPFQVNPGTGLLRTLERFTFVRGLPGIWCCQQNGMAGRASKDWLPLANHA
jgi:hypothetical protein